ncbi:MAG: class I SAM-dependent methyltransferase [Chloroflexia bacterium]
MPLTDPTSSRFEQPEIWDIDPLDNPFYTEKFRLMSAMIPATTQMVLDLGCGSGVQTNLLAITYHVIGADRSLEALKRVGARGTRVQIVCCSAERLPFPSNSFDLVFSSQLLEHLPSGVLESAIREMKRVARSWILLSVPFRENLRVQWSYCNRCQGPFHIYGHVQSFDLRRLHRLFEGWDLRCWTHCGEHGLDYHPWLLRIRQSIGRKWYYYPPAYPVCPRCGNREFAITYGNRIARWCDWLNEHFLRRPRAKDPYWIVTLWERGKRQ